MATPTPIGGEETAEGWNLPTDVFVEILLLLPAIVRWRLRLVCRHWRDVIRERTPATDNPVPLAFVVNYSDHTPKRLWASAHAIDDLAEGRCREAWRSKLLPLTTRYREWHRRYAPATGETLVVPPLPGSAQWVRCWDTGMRRGWHEAYSFAYHPGTAQYKVVHVPCYLDRSGGFSELQVFTLGQPSWRDVPDPGPGGASCRLEAGIVSIHGVTHWITKDTERVASFDVKAERVASTTALPVRSDPGYTWRLTEVRGRLGFVSIPASRRRWRPVKLPQIIDVWVLGAGRDQQQGWSHRYSVEMWVRERQLAWPQFEHGGYVLTTTETWDTSRDKYVYAHRMRLVAGSSQSGEEVRTVRITE
ncbi:hypothetical protein BS78_07G176800 [Paspalum vaginatum]|nr:hypothetical protein BS78_07G176800 [Paspalum vaginatum]